MNSTSTNNHSFGNDCERLAIDITINADRDTILNDDLVDVILINESGPSGLGIRKPGHGAALLAA